MHIPQFVNILQATLSPIVRSLFPLPSTPLLSVVVWSHNNTLGGEPKLLRLCNFGRSSDFDN